MTTATIAPVKVGDVFTASWGYDQTNVDWFIVTDVSKSGKSATFMEVCGSTVADNGPATYIAADASAAVCAGCMRAIRPLVKTSGEKVWRHVSTGQVNCYVDRVYGLGDIPDRYIVKDGTENRVAKPNTFRRRLKVYGTGDVWANADASYKSMKLWDGKAKYQTGIGWGH